MKCKLTRNVEQKQEIKRNRKGETREKQKGNKNKRKICQTF
jgi:hypothetical protein